MDMLKTGLRPSDIMTRAAFRNAITLVMTLGGSTNAVLHFLAIARAVGVQLTLDDFQVGRLLPPGLPDCSAKQGSSSWEIWMGSAHSHTPRIPQPLQLPDTPVLHCLLSSSVAHLCCWGNASPHLSGAPAPPQAREPQAGHALCRTSAAARRTWQT